MAKAKTKSAKASFSKEKETKNTVRFREDVEDDETPIIRTLYLQNGTYEELGEPDSVEVTVTPA